MEEKSEEKREIKIKYGTIMKMIIVIEILSIIGILLYGFLK